MPSSPLPPRSLSRCRLPSAFFRAARAALQPKDDASLQAAAPGYLARAQLRSNTQLGDTVLPVHTIEGFHVGGIVRLHAGFPNQEDHRVRAIAHTALYLASSGLEFPHSAMELVHMLAVAPDCPNNCSSRAACVDGVCACPPAFGGDDCSISKAWTCDHDCSNHGRCISGACLCDPGYTGGSCAVVKQECLSNCSGHGLCSEQGDCACEPGFRGEDCSIATPDCPRNCTGHGTCANSECTCDFGYAGAACDVVVGGCPGNCSAHGECLRNGQCACEAGFSSSDCGSVSAFALCPHNCSGHGACVFGQCRCDAGYEGDGCDQVVSSCEKNCSGHGEGGHPARRPPSAPRDAI